MKEPSSRRTLLGQVAVLLAAVLLGTMLVPTGVNAASDSFVKIRDFS